jgi:hypothetical protein
MTNERDVAPWMQAGRERAQEAVELRQAQVLVPLSSPLLSMSEGDWSGSRGLMINKMREAGKQQQAW